MKNKLHLRAVIYSISTIAFVMAAMVLLSDTEAQITISAVITNTVPTADASTFECDDMAGITLTQNDTKTINCWGQLYDSNGYQDISSCYCDLYQLTGSESWTDSDDNRNHYSDASGTLQTGSGQNIWCNCSFDVYYHANNGNWTIYINATDADSKTTGNRTGDDNNVTILSLGVATYSDTLSWTGLLPGNDSTYRVVYVVDEGNVDVDGIRLNLSHNLVCSTRGEITMGNVRYNKTGSATPDQLWDAMCQLSNNRASTCARVYTTFDLHECDSSGAACWPPGAMTDGGGTGNWTNKVKPDLGTEGTCSDFLKIDPYLFG